MKGTLIGRTRKHESSGMTRQSLNDFQDERLRKPEMPAQLSKLYTNTQLL